MADITRRQLGSIAGAGVLAAALPRGAAAAATASTFDPTPFVHPELRFLVPSFLKFKAAGSFSQATLAPFRATMSAAKPDPAAQIVTVPGSGGGPEVRAYVLGRREAGGKRPAILYVHGGGFVGGTAAGDTAQLHALADALDCVIVSVEYRLAPETPFPGPLEDCYAGLRWLYRNAAALGVDPQRIAIMGESAGGGLAAMLAIAARDRGEVSVRFQLLVYPMLDDRTGSTRAVAPPVGWIGWDAAANRFGWTSFLGRPAGSASVPPGSVPARVERLAGLPRTFIGVGSIDLFVAEDTDYARRLIEAGVPTELLVVPGAFHGFQHAAPKAAVSQRFDAAIRTALAEAFAQRW